MTNTTVTIEDTFQVLDSIPVAPPGSTAAQYFEQNPSGGTQLPLNTNVLNVTFVTTKASTSYIFNELRVLNTVDANPIIIPPPEITSVSTTGFTCLFSGVADTTNYYLFWSVVVPT